MKRWGFSGGNATHGNSKAHRSHGSMGGCQVINDILLLKFLDLHLLIVIMFFYLILGSW